MLRKRNIRATRRRELQAELEGMALAGLVDAGVIAACADGEIAAEELDVVSDVIQGFAQGQASSREIRELMVASAEAITEQGYEARLEALAENLFTDELKSLGLQVAAAVLLSDSDYNEDEDEVYDDIASALDIDEDTAVEIFNFVAENIDG
jgi:hypothetical protein